MREKLIDLFFDYQRKYNTLVVSKDGLADHLIHHGVTVQQWIPVSERLPEESGIYIVCCDDSECSYGDGIWYQSGVVVCANVDVGIYGGICWEWPEGGTLYDLEGIVTHWMPLPEPPKGE